jgi:hypothetical protein
MFGTATVCDQTDHEDRGRETPVGMTHVAIAASTINANRIVYAEGSVNLLLVSGSAATGGWSLSSDADVVNPSLP